MSNGSYNDTNSRQFPLCKLSEGCVQTVSFTNFLAETISGELSFFIRNDNKLAFLQKNPLKHALFTVQAADNNKEISEENKRQV